MIEISNFLYNLARGLASHLLSDPETRRNLLRRAYRQFPVDPKDYNLLGFCYKGKFYFDTRCPFGLRSSAMICQRMTKAVVHIFTEQGFLADVYLDDF